MLRKCLLVFLIAAAAVAEDVRAVLEPVEQTLITSEVNSKVNEINRKMGETFEKGDVLIKLDDVVFLANLTKAKAQLDKAETDYASAQQLYKDRVISHSDYKETEAAVAVAQADLALAKKAYDGCFIQAPYPGSVIDVYVKLYERVEQGQNLIAILDDSSLIARVLIPETYLGKIKVGDTVQVRIMETGTVENAKIIRMGAILDPVSSLLKVEAEISNENRILRPGMEGKLLLQKNGAKRP